MRTITWIIAVGLLLAVSVTAQAVSIPPGPAAVSFHDYTSLYRAPSTRAGQTQDPVPNASVFVPTFPGDDNRSTFNVSTIGDVPPFSFTSTNTEQLKGLFYDLTPVAVVPPVAPATSSTIFYGSLGRNPITTVTALSTGSVLTVGGARPAGTGGVIEIWRRAGAPIPAGELFSPLGTNVLGSGPTAWDEKDSLNLITAANLGTAGGTAGHAIGPDGFPTINANGEELWLQLTFISFPGAGIAGSGVPAGTVLREVVEIGSANQGDGFAYAMVTGGTYASQIQANGMASIYTATGFAVPAGMTVDMSIGFRVNPNEPPPIGFAGPWGADSFDPARVSIVPEPVTMLGVMLSLGGLVNYVRRRRAA